jgi:hypothetical protein
MESSMGSETTLLTLESAVSSDQKQWKAHSPEKANENEKRQQQVRKKKKCWPGGTAELVLCWLAHGVT